MEQRVPFVVGVLKASNNRLRGTGALRELRLRQVSVGARVVNQAGKASIGIA